MGVGIASGNANRVQFRIELRDVFNGGVWVPISRGIVIDTSENDGVIFFSPFLIIPKNHDVRVRAKADSNTAQVFAELSGYLAAIV